VREVLQNAAWNAKKMWKIANIKGQWQISLPFENAKNVKMPNCQCKR